MKTIKVCIVGAGNISNTRHIPALKKMKNVEITGVISDSQNKIDRTCKKYKINNSLLVNNPKNDIKLVEECEWFKEVDAVVIGTPPHQHHPFAKISLQLKKDVLVEKPMTMNEEEATELIKLAKENDLILNVVHNFQFATQMKKLNAIIENKKYGEISSIVEIQFSNRNRRLPVWYNELPLGLFYDEAAHFIYLLEKHGGKTTIDNVFSQYTENKKDNTPKMITINATSGTIPVTMILNFNSPICEWYYIVNFEKRILIYDLFKDILINLPTDNEHYSKDILFNDIRKTWQYWFKFVVNGFKRVTGNLFYGHDDIFHIFINSVRERNINADISGEKGRDTIITMNEIVEKVNKR